jgi:lipopolysaccharide transport system ATP-binding protein
LCDVAMWIDGGKVREFGPTEGVLGAYEMHTRLQNQAQERPPKVEPVTAASVASVASAAAEPVSAEERPAQAAKLSESAAIISVTLLDLKPGEGDAPGILDSTDLVASIVVRGHGEEQPNIGFMIEQSRGVGITSLATHEEDAAPRRLGNGLWESVLTFPNLPLHSGEYVVSAFLFDTTGLVVYEQWYHYQHFRFISPTLMPGLVRLPHHWS